MSHNATELLIASSPVRDAIPKDKPLAERIEFAMRYVREHKDAIFWMAHTAPDDDLMFRTALSAVILAGDDSDRDIIERSMKPVRALSALLSGVPVDVERAMDVGGDVLPLIGMWRNSGEPR